MTGRQGGFLLLPVVLALALIASVAFLLSREGAVHVRRAATEAGIDGARYVAEAGLEHQRWRTNAGACAGYTDLPPTDFGAHSYSATVAPTGGSPVAITATGELADGTRHTLSRAGVTVFDAPRTVTLQPGRIDGKDTYLKSSDPDANQGVEDRINVDPAGPPNADMRTLIEFDLGGLPPETQVQAAQLELYLQTSAGSQVIVDAHRATGDWTEDGATWNDRDGGIPWTTPGGDYDATAVDTYAAGSTGWKTLDVVALVQGWVDGSYPNHGLLLRTAPQSGNKIKRHHSSDSAQCALRPKLALTYRCQCGGCSFPPPPAPVCSADYTPDDTSGSFSTAAIGASDVWGLTFLRDCTLFNGVTAPLDGAWLLVDAANKTFYMTDTTGALLTTLATPKDDMLDAAYVHAGAWRDHLAVTEGSEMRVYLLDLSGAVQDFFPTDAFTEHPVGVAYIGRTASGAYENHLAVTSDKDAFGASSGGVYIVDQAGDLKKSIDISVEAPEPWGIAHVSGTDKLLVARKDGGVVMIDLDGNFLGQYDSLAAEAQGIAINPMTCEHVVNDKGNEEILYLEKDS